MLKGFFFKVCLLGDGGVGKTSLRRRFAHESFEQKYLMTIGADFSLVEYEIDDETVKLQIWDLAGQPMFSNVRPRFYEGSNGFILVYDITRPETLKNISNWIEESSQHIKDQPVVLVGNKADLRKGTVNATTPEMGKKMASELEKKFNLPVIFYETSAKTNSNVETMFTKFIKMILKSKY